MKNTALVFLIISALITGGCADEVFYRGGSSWPERRERVMPMSATVQQRVSQAAPDIHFSGNSHAISPAEANLLAKAAPELKQMIQDYPDLMLIIEGYCDDRGSAAQNSKLGLQRADAVRQILIDQGVPFTHLRVESKGNTELLCSTRDKECRQANRRVHFTAVHRVVDPD